jgi:hypothetical protein
MGTILIPLGIILIPLGIILIPMGIILIPLGMPGLVLMAAIDLAQMNHRKTLAHKEILRSNRS